MAYGMDDRVREQGTHSGTGAVTLPNVAVSGFQTFLAGWGASGTGEYCIVIGSQWETGFGTLNAGGTSLTRTTVYDGSSGAGVTVNFSSGTADIFGATPAELAHFLNMREIAVASATTTDIGAVRGSQIEITGTTTITGFGTSKNRRRSVRFSGALTLTHNATSLILPGAANITTVAGDTAEFISDNSGNWRCIHYNRASLAPIDGAAFVGYTPTVTASSGTFTSVSATGASKNFGRVTKLRATVTITTIGTAAGRMLVSVPTGTVVAIGAGGAIGLNGGNGDPLIGTAFFDSNTTISFVKATDRSFPGTSGETLYVWGEYERT